MENQPRIHEKTVMDQGVSSVSYVHFIFTAMQRREAPLSNQTHDQDQMKDRQLVATRHLDATTISGKAQERSCSVRRMWLVTPSKETLQFSLMPMATLALVDRQSEAMRHLDTTTISGKAMGNMNNTGIGSVPGYHSYQSGNEFVIYEEKQAFPSYLLGGVFIRCHKS